MSESRGKYKIRIMKPDEVGRVNDLVIALHNHQNMANVPRVPTKEDARRELLYEDAITGELKSNNKRTFVVVACDMSKENDPDHKDVIGYLIYGQSFSIMRGRGFWLTSFFIEEEYRSHGLGKKMINFIKLHALKSGSPTLDVGYMNANIAGQRFYARFGSRNVNEDYQMMMIQFADAQ